MTDRQFQDAVLRHVKFYKIWLQRTQMRKLEIPQEKFEHSWNLMNWVNKCNIYDSELKRTVRYVSSDKLYDETLRYLRDLEYDEQWVIKQATERIKNIESAIVKVHR